MKQSFTLLLILLFSPLTWAENALHYGQVNLDASASTDVNNDELVVRLQVFEQGQNPTTLTNLVNKKTALLLDALKNFAAITAKTSGYSTRPIYHKGEIEHWQVSQNLVLETGAFEQMSQFIADISTLAHIESMQFRVSRQQAEQVRTALTEEAIGKFKDKAGLIARQFDSSSYKLVSLSVDGNTIRPMPVLDRSAVMMADSAQTGVPAALAAGTNEISVQVRGSIQLQLEN